MIYGVLRILVIALLAIGLWCDHPAAQQNGPACVKLDREVKGEKQKYSVTAQVNGPVFFADLGCGLRYRNEELCAMEMISFDISAKVYDYDTMEELEMSKAFFVVPEKKEDGSPIVAFASEDAATRFATERGTGKVLDYDGLIKWSEGE